MSEYNNENIYSKRLKAGKRRTYFFDVRSTKNNDYFVTLTESKKRYDSDGYDRHKIFLYKEDFNKFLAALTDTINHVKTSLMPDFDFDAFDYENDEDDQSNNSAIGEPDSSSFIEPQNSTDNSNHVNNNYTEELSSGKKHDTINTESNLPINPTAHDEAETW